MFSYKEALNYLNSLINYEKKLDLAYNRRLFNLSRMKAILERLGNPHLSLKAVHIAGTKGKGSTAAIVTSILNSAGYKVGLYTSPHLISPRERIRIGNELIKEEEFSLYLERIKAVVENIKYEGTSLHPTFFEVYTALAFTYFYHKGVDIAVVEVGLGGRLDATNVIRPLVEVITPVSFDHTQQLGNEITSIAKEKAGIIKPGSKVVISRQEREVISLLQKICKQRDVRFYKVGEDIKFNLKKATPRYQVFDVDGILQKYSSIFLPLPGEHQLWNATTAIGVVELLQEYGFAVPVESVKSGISSVKWPGRIQMIARKPVTLVDCAHNGASAQCLAKFLREFYPGKNIIIIMGILKNKDLKTIAEALCPLAMRVVVTHINSPRALSVDEIYAKIKGYCREKPIKEWNLKRALGLARRIAGEDGVVCITGSIYLVGEVLGMTHGGNIEIPE